VQLAFRKKIRIFKRAARRQEAAFAERSPAAAGPCLISRENADAFDESGLNRFNKEHSRRLAANETLGFRRSSRHRRLTAAVRNDVSVSVSVEASHRVRVVSIVIQREDYFANPP